MTMELSDQVQSLVNFLRMNPSEKKMTFEHNPGHKLIPFFTRNPERYKFQEEFLEISGIIARLSQNKAAELEEIEPEFLSNLRSNLDIDGDVSDSELSELFQTSFTSTKRAQLLTYIPVASGNEKVGKQQVARFMIELLDLKNNQEWQHYISAKEENDLYSMVLSNALPELKTESNYEKKFSIQNADHYRSLFAKDFHTLMQSENYNFISLNINQLLSYYFLIYLINEGPSFGKIEEKRSNIYFAYEKEKVSASRLAVTNGYERVKEQVGDILVNNDLTDYLNVLVGNVVPKVPETFDREVSISKILSGDRESLTTLTTNLRSFNRLYAETNDKEYAYSDSNLGDKDQLLEEAKILKEWLTEDTKVEIKSRFKKPYDEIRNLGYLKSRGRLGSVLNASQELILLFTAIVVGKEQHMLVKRVFEGLEQHGLMFDKLSKKEIVDFFEEINLLEKMSDSGDAQYVKPIL